ncbi:MAG: 16S rRNA (cytosine(1402)-N(4))-methyltransferase RsmH [Thermodesulfovibrio sp.]|nr:16S rRNA (cytosine(1402)-N(4))-methyltransferase RsmH [Thermodesulfovibrio sp.]
MLLVDMDFKIEHTPVMVKEVLEILNLKRDGVYVDATIGCGGHTKEILKRISSEGRVVGIDRDEAAIKRCKEELSDPRLFLVKANFSQLKEILKELNIEEVDGVFFDLGISMMQLRDFSRGFSFYSSERLDMRMDQSSELTAWDVVNKYSERRLIQIFEDYADEPFAKKIAKEIIRKRQTKTIDTCKELSEIIEKIVPKKRIHPATRVFQAIRVEVNKEFEELKRALSQAVEVLKKKGRVCVISYHSGEDRIVKNFFKEQEKKGILRILTKKPIYPSLEEIIKNPSSRSARIRGGEKI